MTRRADRLWVVERNGAKSEWWVPYTFQHTQPKAREVAAELAHDLKVRGRSHIAQFRVRPYVPEKEQ